MGSQEIALRLREFWKGEGCPIIPPYGAIAAGGLTPDLFFGALGPEPWRSCQEVTTLDSSAVRYNGDPLRPILDHHLQVALQEQSGELREVFTESLRMLGIQARDRDVRFVACSGEDAGIAVRAPCWHVTVDGIEVGSVFHLQRVGGVDVDRVPVIADYSLGRLAIVGAAYAGKETPTERDRQTSTYVLAQANPERTRLLFSLHADECEGALATGLFFPAYDHVLACLSLLEMFDACSDLSARERAVRTSRISDLANRCAKAYLEGANA